MSLSSGPPRNRREYIISTKFFPKPKDQGGQHSCVGWAVGYAAATFYNGLKKQLDVSKDENALSPSYLYQSIKKQPCNNCNCGTKISDALNFLKNIGVVPLSLFPYNESFCNKPDDDLKTIANNYRIKSWWPVDDINNFNEFKTLISNDKTKTL